MEESYKLHGDVLAEHGVDQEEALLEVKTAAPTEVTNV